MVIQKYFNISYLLEHIYLTEMVCNKILKKCLLRNKNIYIVIFVVALCHTVWYFSSASKRSSTFEKVVTDQNPMKKPKGAHKKHKKQPIKEDKKSQYLKHLNSVRKKSEKSLHERRLIVERGADIQNESLITDVLNKHVEFQNITNKNILNTNRIHKIKIDENIHDKSTRYFTDVKSDNITKGNRNTVSTHENGSSTTKAALSHISENDNLIREYTFTDPKLYKGQHVDAWPPSKNRSVSLYMMEQFTMIPKRKHLHNKRLIIIIPSLPHEIKERLNVRKGWAKEANKKTAVLFLLGNEKTRKQHQYITKYIHSENRSYGDIIRIDGLIEHYNNLTLKSLYALKFFLSRHIGITGRSQYMLKVDADYIVNIPLLYYQLTKGNKYKDSSRLLMGCCFCCGTGMDCGDRMNAQNILMNRSADDHCKVLTVHRKSNNMARWQVPDYMYSGSDYPSYLAGMGYVLSRTSAECIYKKALETPYFHLEDVYVTGFVAQACKIKRLDNPGFSYRFKAFDKNKDIVCPEKSNF